MKIRQTILVGISAIAAPLAAVAQESLAAIPDNLLDDDHVREEMGVNQFTAPSIKKLFDEMALLRPLPFDELHRDFDKVRIPSGRTRIALQLGSLLADGFLCIDAKKHEDVIKDAKLILNHAKALGLGRRLEPHSKSLIEKSVLDDWDGLREELATTQKDVERELVSLRDAGVAHLISLGGWIRGFEIAATAASRPYTEEKAKQLVRLDLVTYFADSLSTMAPGMRERDLINDLRDALLALQSDLSDLENKTPTLEQVKSLEEKSRILWDFLQKSIENS